MYSSLRLATSRRGFAPVVAGFALGLAALPAASSGDSQLRTMTYYVDARLGNDAASGTSRARAWRSLDRASAARLRPGDRLLLRRGMSWTGQLIVRSTGTAARRILVGAYGTGPRPLLHAASTCVLVSGSFIRLTGLHVDGCSWAGISVSGSSVQIDHSLSSHNAAGIEIRPESRSDQILSNELIDNNRMSVLTETPANDDSGAFGVLIRGDDVHVAGNRISGSDAFSFDYGRDGAAVEIYGGRRNVIERNVAADDNAFTELGNARSADNTFAYNLFTATAPNATFLVTRGPKDAHGPVLGTRVYNNTADLTGAGSQGVVCYAGCSGQILTLRNNIIVARSKAAYADAPFDEAADVFYGGLVQTAIGRGTVVADPRFRSPTTGDFHLRPSSPAVDRGVLLGFVMDLDGAKVPVDGNRDGRAAPDGGAFEFRPAQRRAR